MDDCPFKPFDMVLVRNSDNDTWTSALFGWHNRDDGGQYVMTRRASFDQYIPFKSNEHFYAMSRWASFGQCIPFKGNEHLVDTTGKPKAGEKD